MTPTEDFDLVRHIQALAPGSGSFLLDAIRAHATKIKDTRKDQPAYSPEGRDLAISILKEILNHV